MRSVEFSEAKARLSALIDEVSAGTEITVTRDGEPVARIVPASNERRREFGLAKALFDRGEIVVADDFDAPLPDASCSMLDVNHGDVVHKQ